MTVKTCIVMGHFELGSTDGVVFESAVFGYSCNYDSAHSFIQAVRDSHHKIGSKLTITNVIIG
jgi:hypothetical protein